MALKDLASNSAMDGYSKIEQQPFTEEGFKDKGAVFFDGEKTIAVLTEIKSRLNSISKVYDKIADLYGEALKCTASGKKMGTDTEDGKQMTQFKKKADARAEVCRIRKNELAQKIESISDAVDLANAYNSERVKEGAADASSLEATSE